ncbi:MAG: hypothetical protein ACLP01_03520 [Solirubrobacteraceae bacterium]
MAIWFSRHRKVVFRSRLALFIVLAAAISVAGTRFSDSNRLPQHRVRPAGQSWQQQRVGEDRHDHRHTTTWSATGRAARVLMTKMLQRVSAVSGVESVISPFTASGRRDVSKDGRTAYATVVFFSTSHADQANASP